MFCRDIVKTFKAEDMLIFLGEIAFHRQEHFVVLTLNNNNEVIKKHVVFIGTVNAAIVHPREVFACALEDSAVSIVVAHNHPSGDPTPSRHDKEATKQLTEAGQILAIKLEDHIVVVEKGYFSFKEKGMI